MKKIEVQHQSGRGFNPALKWVLLLIISFFSMFFVPKEYQNFYGLFIFLVVIPYCLYRLILKPLLRFLGVKKAISKITPERKGSDLQFTINGATKIENPFAGIFICGGAGSGKSKSLIEPSIKEAGKKNYTGVIYDFKFPELAQYTESAYKNNTEVSRYYFNFEDLNRSHKINPIAPELMTNESFAREFAYTILVNLNPQMIDKPDFWSDNATSLLAATFWYLREKHPQFCTLPHAISMILQPSTTALLMELSSVPKSADMIAPILTAFHQKADNQLAGVISSLQVSLSKINIDEIYYLMTATDFSLQLNNAESKGILTLGNSPALASTYAPIIGLILASVAKQLNRQNKEKSIFMVDEFPTVYIPNIEQLPATARSNKVVTILACQDIAQLTDKYGKEKAETVLSNLGNQFYGRTPNPATAKRVSELFGKADKNVVSTNEDIGIINWRKSQTHSTRESDNVKVQEVAQLETGSFYTLLSEGANRQGLSQIPMDKNFQKSEIPEFKNVGENDLKNAYNKVKSDISDVILKDMLSALKP